MRARISNTHNHMNIKFIPHTLLGSVGQIFTYLLLLAIPSRLVYMDENMLYAIMNTISDIYAI